MKLPRGLLGNGALLRAQLSFGAAFVAEWSFMVAIGLVAFADGGAFAVGVVGMLRLVPAALLGPAIAAYADRMPRERVLIASSAVRGVATLAIAPILLVDGPITAVYILAVLSTIAFTPFRASHSALLPSLCKSPDELTTVNVVRGGFDSLSVILGPLLAALLVEVSEVAAVFVFAGVSGLVSAALLLRLAYERMPVAAPEKRHLVAEVHEGLRAVAASPGVGLVVGFTVLQTAVRGAFTVFVVVIAIDLLNGTESSVGVLQGAVGLGALLGSGLCTMLVGSRAMTRWLGVAIVLWGAPLAVIGALPYYVVALVAAAVIGIGNAMVDVTAFTLVARMSPDAVMARVFGVLESLIALSVGLGALIAPILIELFGIEGALFAVGAVTPVACVVWWHQLTAIDHMVAVRTDEIGLLREVPMLRPLPVPVLEHLALRLDRHQLRAGETLFAAGDSGDSFYIVASGVVRVLDNGAEVRKMGTGQGFGEIALLGDTTRTMTVQAVDDAKLVGIQRAHFLPAIRSFGDATSAAQAARSSYLADAPGQAPPDLD